MKIKIDKVVPPSDKQLKRNMLGTVNISLISDTGQQIVTLYGMTLKKSKTGAFFLSEPSYKAGDKWFSHYRLLPMQDDAKNSLTAEVIKLLKEAGFNPETTEPNPTGQQTPTPANTSAGEPWDLAV